MFLFCQQQVSSSTHPQGLMQERSNLRGLLQPNGNAVYVQTGPSQYQAVQPQYAHHFQNRFPHMQQQQQPQQQQQQRQNQSGAGSSSAPPILPNSMLPPNQNVRINSHRMTAPHNQVSYFYFTIFQKYLSPNILKKDLKKP